MCRNGRHCGFRLVERPTDISDVIDVDQPDSLAAAGSTLLEHTDLPKLPPHCRIFTFPTCPGLVFFRKGLEPNLQRRLTVQCLADFPSPPAHTNFDRSLGRSLPPGLWDAAQAKRRLGPPVNLKTNSENEIGKGEEKQKKQFSSGWVSDGDGMAATTLLKKLRWSSIGLIYDWTRRIYVSEWGFVPLPEELATLAKNLVHLASLITTTAATTKTKINDNDNQPALENKTKNQTPPAPIFTPDAALINYYHEGDTLNGHIDDAEPDMSQPLVSLSLGRPGIFLIGGFSREIEPIPILLRNGDAVILGGYSRRCYHGVPRIFPYKGEEVRNSGSSSGEKKNENGGVVGARKGKGMQRALLGPEMEKTDWGECIEEGRSVDFSPFEQHMNGCRINVSIRSVGGAGAAGDPMERQVLENDKVN